MRALVMTALAGVVLAAMTAWVLDSVRRARPGAVSAAWPSASRAVEARPLALAPGESVWQAFYLPLCSPRDVTVTLEGPIDAPGALHAAWFLLENPSLWPDAPVHESTALLAPGDTQVSIEMPAAIQAGGRLVGLRLTADRVAIALPVTRDDVLPGGYLMRRIGYVSADDLVLHGDQGTATATGEAIACAARAQPPLLQQPAWLLLGALVGVTLAGAWIAGLLGVVARP